MSKRCIVAEMLVTKRKLCSQKNLVTHQVKLENNTKVKKKQLLFGKQFSKIKIENGI